MLSLNAVADEARRATQFSSAAKSTTIHGFPWTTIPLDIYTYVHYNWFGHALCCIPLTTRAHD